MLIMEQTGSHIVMEISFLVITISHGHFVALT